MKRNPVILQLFFCFCVYTSSQDEISCDLPHYEHVTNPLYHFGGDKGLGVTKSYVCDSGFKKGAELAMCTENGWFPKPLCTEIVCSKLTIGNAKPLEQLQLTYKPGAQIEYQCLHQSETDRFYITCNQNGNWDNVRGCTEPSTCLKPGAISNGIIKEPALLQIYYSIGSTVEYKCSEGYVFENDNSARCIGPHWSYPKCTATTEHCSQPPSIPDAVLDFKYWYEDGEQLRLDCPAYYVQEGDQYLTCRGGGWIGKGKCLKPCTVDVQVLDNNNIKLLRGGRQKVYLQHGDYISFVCKGRLKFAKDSVGYRQQCTDGHVPLPVCE